jgi:tripartite-type tricarboxylate transporter receptor subunit TctC
LFLAQYVSSAQAADVSFKGKKINLVIGYAAGGGTDATGRLMGRFFGKYLPGKPDIIVRNMPGADGLTALNYMWQQTARDGLSVTVNSSVQADPLVYRKANAVWDPTKFHVIGGVGRGGSYLLTTEEGAKRLYDKSKPPAVMGSVGSLPRSGMLMTAWGIRFLGWNAKWVVGYKGTQDVMLALERKEVDMTSTGNLFSIQSLLNGSGFKVLYQTGILQNGKMVARPELGSPPVFNSAIEGKIEDPIARAAFSYWQNISTIDKWAALMPGTPKDIVEAYRVSFGQMVKDREFLDGGQKISASFEAMDQKEVEFLIHELARTPDEATGYTKDLLRSQGLRVK